MKKKYFYPFIILFILFIIFSFSLFYKNNKKFLKIEIGDQEYSAEVVSSENEREKGLSGRNGLCENCAMLFIFPKPGKYSFWMKNMNFNLDIIWVSGKKIVYIAKDVSSDYPYSINPVKEADKVIEIKGGLSNKLNLRTGDEINMRP